MGWLGILGFELSVRVSVKFQGQFLCIFSGYQVFLDSHWRVCIVDALPIDYSKIFCASGSRVGFFTALMNCGNYSDASIIEHQFLDNIDMILNCVDGVLIF